MGLVAVTFKIMPEGPETDINKIKSELQANANVKEIKEIPIAFGIKLIEVLLVFEDKEGIGSIEQKLRSIEGVASVESGDVTLL
ncbi:elongation factor 1-beta [archaeon]|nr:elongation factor 1-beta [archaeon]